LASISRAFYLIISFISITFLSKSSTYFEIDISGTDRGGRVTPMVAEAVTFTPRPPFASTILVNIFSQHLQI